MLRKPVHFILYLSTLQKPAAGAGFCNVLKYKADTFYFSTIQKLAPGEDVSYLLYLGPNVYNLYVFQNTHLIPNNSDLAW